MSNKQHKFTFSQSYELFYSLNKLKENKVYYGSDISLSNVLIIPRSFELKMLLVYKTTENVNSSFALCKR